MIVRADPLRDGLQEGPAVLVEDERLQQQVQLEDVELLADPLRPPPPGHGRHHQKEDKGLRYSKGKKRREEKNIVILNRQLSDQFLS